MKRDGKIIIKKDLMININKDQFDQSYLKTITKSHEISSDHRLVMHNQMALIR